MSPVVLLPLAVLVLYASALAYTPAYLCDAEVLFALNAHSIASTARDVNGRFLPLYFQVYADMWFQPVIVYFTALFLTVLPVTETTGLPYASKQRQRDKDGKDVGLMHACGHDMHMTCWVGTAQTLKAVTGTGSDCAGGAADLTHAVQFGAAVGNQTLTFLTPLQPAAVGLAVCVTPSAATSYSATISGFVAP